MKLKELHIFGFKSFADKTYLEFGQDITIVVGPNGSGKSNVFDAIRWVLGEQSAKSLRGGKMEDVIFIGSDSRKTLGMAEVSIVMDNTDKTINLPYEEVKVTRRLYRSGDSEYMINDQPVRLKDIVEIFMDTGVGLDSYSIISQGEVDRIINAKPTERREIFEEAAGITKYIRKRDEGLRKLEATEANMLRINDILTEVKRQTSVLERQAKKAEQYKVLKQECGDMEIRMHKKDIKERAIKQKEYAAKKEEVDKKIEAEEAGLVGFEKQFEEMKFNSLEMEKSIAEKREKFVIKQEEIKRLEDSLKYLTDKKNELASRIEALKNENVENVGKIENIKTDITQKVNAIAGLESGIKDREAQLENLNRRHDEFVAGLEEQKKNRDTKDADSGKVLSELNSVKNRIVELELTVKSLEERGAKIAAEKDQAAEKLKHTEIEIDALTGNRITKTEDLKGLKEREESLLKDKLRRKGSLATVEEAHRELGLTINRLESRLNFLKQMQGRMEGYGEIVRKVLSEYRQQLKDEEKGDLVDVVANLIKVAKPYERAVEMTLAGLLQTVLVRNERLIEEVFSLYEKEKGEISFINTKNMGVDYKTVIDAMKGSVTHKNIIAHLPSAITTDEKNEPVKLLFHNIFIVENIARAREVLADVKKEAQYYLLTQNGELVSNYNIYTKGEGLAGEGLLSREREIAEIETEISSASGRLSAIGEEKAFQISKIEGLEKEIEQLSVTYHNQYVEVIKDDERIKQKNEDLERHKSDIVRIEAELKNLEAEKQALDAGRQALTLEESRIMASLDALKAEFEAIKQDITKREGEVASERALIEAKRLEIGSLSSEFDFEKNNKQMLETRLTELQASYDSTSAQVEELNTRVRATEDEARANDEKINEFKGSLAGDESTLEAAKREHEEFSVRMKALEDDIKKMSKLRDQLKDEQYDIKIKINEIETSVKVIYEKLMLDFKIQPTEEEVYAVEVTPEEYTELSVKVGEFRDKMERLGVVNMVAIEEYNELKSRSEHLQTQYNDLNTARENLKKIIKKANEESKTLFTEAFAGIRVKFAEVFTKMFNGGEADLVLSDTENILESGIDIIARPPGKKLQNISLLSGGEKAITAVSLLFALFLTKASPFCIMDEIDAPLDDVNVTRFTNLIKSFKKTQFIIISHNKLTMEIGNVLYGVTMAKAGVSQIISVKMEKDKDKVKSLLEHDGKSKAAVEFEELQKEHAEEAKKEAEEADGEK